MSRVSRVCPGSPRCLFTGIRCVRPGSPVSFYRYRIFIRGGHSSANSIPYSTVQYRRGRPLLSRPRGAVDSGLTAVLSRSRFSVFVRVCVFGFGWMVVRFVRVIRLPACARVSRVSRVCPGSPRCLFTDSIQYSTVQYCTVFRVTRQVKLRQHLTWAGKKTPRGAGTHTGHTGHTGARGQTDHTDEPHNHPPKPKDTNVPARKPARPTQQPQEQPQARSRPLPGGEPVRESS